LLDLKELIAGPAEETVVADLADAAAVEEAMRDADAVIHLGGHAKEAPFENVLRINVGGTHNVLEAARRNGVDRVVIASSFHAVGWLGWRDEAELPAASAPRPDSYYGWSKTAMESLGRLYADRFGLRVFCVRIGTCCPEPRIAKQLATWLSPDDAGRLVEACLSTPEPGFHTVWGISANTRRWWSLAEGAAIGYHPKDDAEAYADTIATEVTAGSRLGGPFAEVELGRPL
jgi:nucleoside-diphosphate-sugar epimerase